MPPRPQSIPTDLVARAFSTDEAARVGVSKRRLQGQQIRSLGRSLHCDALTPVSWEAKVCGWLSVLPEEAALYGRSAARWWGVPMPDDSAVVHIVVPSGDTKPRKRPGLRPHSGSAPVTVVRGVRVTIPAHTFLDLAAERDAQLLVVVGDDLLTRSLVTREDLDHVVGEATGARGVVLARQIVPMLRTGVDSPRESILRWRMLEHGLPCPVVNPEVYDDAGGWLARPDLAYPELRIAIQYEGDGHRTSRKRWQQDIMRDEVMRDHGWEIIRVTAAQLRRPWQLCELIRRRMHAQAQRLGLVLDPVSLTVVG